MSASTYSELKAKADALMAEAEKLRQQEKAVVIEELRTKMREYDITVAELTGDRRQTSRRSKSPPKYRGPAGELWCGGPGRRPDWVRKLTQEGRSIEDFRI